MTIGDYSEINKNMILVVKSYWEEITFLDIFVDNHIRDNVDANEMNVAILCGRFFDWFAKIQVDQENRWFPYSIPFVPVNKPKF